MSKQCDHTLGIWDSEYSVVGRVLHINEDYHKQRDSLSRIHPEDMEWFSYCPDCGSKITEEMKK